MLLQVALIAAVVAVFTLVPGVAMIVSARREQRRTAALSPIERGELGRSGTLVGKVVGTATTKGAISNAPALLVRYHFGRESTQVFGAHHVVLETAEGLRVVIGYSREAFVRLGPHGFHEATFHHADNKPADVGAHLRQKYGTQPFQVYVVEERISVGDSLGAVGTLAACSSGEAGFELVGTPTLPLAVGDAELGFYRDAGTITGKQIFGWVMVILWAVLVGIVATHLPS